MNCLRLCGERSNDSEFDLYYSVSGGVCLC